MNTIIDVIDTYPGMTHAAAEITTRNGASVYAITLCGLECLPTHGWTAGRTDLDGVTCPDCAARAARRQQAQR